MPQTQSQSSLPFEAAHAAADAAVHTLAGRALPAQVGDARLIGADAFPIGLRRVGLGGGVNHTGRRARR